MINGKINRSGQALVAIEMLARDGMFQPIEVVLDTGFTGYLLLPPDTIQRLEVIAGTEIETRLANGQEVRLDSWRGTALWHNRPRRVLILQAEGEPLLGMSLLQGSRVTLDVRVDGDVLIDELIP